MLESFGSESYYYLDILQRSITTNTQVVLGSNVEIYYTEIYILANNEILKVVESEGKLSFLWKCGIYHISGQTNLPKEELIEILENINF